MRGLGYDPRARGRHLRTRKVGAKYVRRRAASALVLAALALSLTAAGAGASLNSNSVIVGNTSPSGIITAGDSKAVCITDGPSTNNFSRLAYTTLNGITYNCLETFSDAMPTWSDWVNPWVASPNGPFVPWVAADPTHHQLIDTQNLIPDSEASNPNWTAECAAGDYNSYATQFATNMIAAGLGSSVIRLAHEMNGNWYNDSLGSTQAQWTQWDECWDQEVSVMRGVTGAHFLFDWNVNANVRDIPLADIYPGNAFVDIIGVDFYDQTGLSIPAVGQPGRFQALAAEPDGLNDVAAFATAMGKPLSIPEWGTVISQGDDPAYVTAMAQFAANNDVAYQSWFNGPDGIYPLDPNQDPLSVNAYVTAFGSPPPPTTTTTEPPTSTTTTLSPTTTTTAARPTTTTTPRPTTTTTPRPTTTTMPPTTTTSPTAAPAQAIALSTINNCLVPRGTFTISVCGNKFVNQSGQTVVLRGANTEGTQYDCTNGGAGFYADPTISAGDYATEIRAMKAWGINVVRVNLNADCWLGLNGVPPATSATGYPIPSGDSFDTAVNSYMNEMGNYVDALNAAGIYAELDLELSTPLSLTSNGAGSPNPVYDDTTQQFWQSVASYFRNNPAVILGGFSQPFPPQANGSPPPGWSCILDGCLVPSYPNDGVVTSSAYPNQGVAQLISDIRQYNTTAPLVVQGPETSGDMNQWLAYYYPGGASLDPSNELASGFSVYFPFGNSPCSFTKDVATACPAPDTSAMVQVASLTPVLADQVGDFGCSNSDMFPFLQSVDAQNSTHGVDIGYLGWAWTTYNCDPNLITDWTTGAPSTMGEAEYCELLDIGVAPRTNGLFSPENYCTGTAPDAEPK